MMYWVLGGALFVLVVFGRMWYEIKNAPLIPEDCDDQ